MAQLEPAQAGRLLVQGAATGPETRQIGTQVGQARHLLPFGAVPSERARHLPAIAEANQGRYDLDVEFVGNVQVGVVGDRRQALGEGRIILTVNFQVSPLRQFREHR